MIRSSQWLFLLAFKMLHCSIINTALLSGSKPHSVFMNYTKVANRKKKTPVTLTVGYLWLSVHVLHCETRQWKLRDKGQEGNREERSCSAWEQLTFPCLPPVPGRLVLARVVLRWGLWGRNFMYWPTYFPPQQLILKADWFYRLPIIRIGTTLLPVTWSVGWWFHWTSCNVCCYKYRKTTILYGVFLLWPHLEI